MIKHWFKVKIKAINGKEYLTFFILLNMLLLPNYYLVYAGADTIVASPVKQIVFLCNAASLLLIPFLVVRPKILFLLFSPIVYLQVFEIISIHTYHQSSKFSLIFTAFSANSSELSSLFMATLPWQIGFIMLTLIYVYLAWKLPLSFHTGKLRVELLAGILLLNGILFARDYWMMRTILPNGTVSEKLAKSQDFFTNRYSKMFPCSYTLWMKQYVETRILMADFEHSTKDFKFDVLPISGSPKTILLVIGETARSASFGINGYERNTTPYLGSVKNLISYRRAFSPANLTAYSLPLMLTRATAKNLDQAYREKTIVSYFKEAGFKTFWYSNNDYSPTDIVYQFCRESDVSSIHIGSMDAVGGATDLNLLDDLEMALADPAPYKFIILHPLGSHFRYDMRYPETFEKWKPVFSSGMQLASLSESNKEMLVNAYDNSILFTDYFLKRCIDHLDTAAQSVMLYTSDHGENLMDDDRLLMFHGNPEPTIYELNVPLIFWFSDAFDRNNSAKTSALKCNAEKVFSTNYLFQLTSDLVGIEQRQIPEVSLPSRWDYANVDSICIFIDGSKYVNPLEYESGIEPTENP